MRWQILVCISFILVSVLYDSTVGLAVAALLPTYLLSLVVRDLQNLCRLSETLREGSALLAELPLKRFFSALGSECLSSLEVVQLKLQSHSVRSDLERGRLPLIDRLESSSPSLNRSCRSPIAAETRQKPYTSEEVVQTALEVLGEKLPVAVGAVSFPVEQKVVWSRETHSKRLRDLVEHHIEIIADDVGEESLRQIDLAFERGAIQDLLQFGIRYVITAPIIPAGSHPAVNRLWVGFSAGYLPEREDLRYCSEVAQQLRREFSVTRMIADINESLEKEKVRADKKDDLIAHVSHDLRSPLNNIKSILHLFQLEPRPVDREELLSVALSNCAGLQEILDDVLTLARHREGRLTKDRTPLRLGELVFQVVERFKFAANDKGISLKFRNLNCEALVDVDAGHLRRALSNLIGNGIKYTSFGEVVVTVEEGAKDGAVEVNVSDTGPGIGEQDLRDIFLPFCRGENDSTEGYGLGLHISQILFRENGGELTAKSVVGRGSTFTVTFERLKSEVPPIEIEEQLLATVGTHSLRRKRILFVDDDLDYLSTLERHYEGQGVLVRKATCVRDAVSICSFEEQDAIVSDLDIPGGGLEALLGQLSLRGQDVPLAVVSGHDLDHRRSELESEGVCSVYLKPVELSVLDRWLLQATATKETQTGSSTRVSIGAPSRSGSSG